MKILLFLAGLALLTLTACVSPAPRNADPLAGINVISRPRGAGAFKNLSVALILSQDSKNAIAYLEEFNKHLFRQNYWGSAKVDTSKLFMSLTDLLTYHFKSVEQVDNLGAAAAMNPDLVAVLDVYTKIAPPPGKRTTTFEAKVLFLTSAGAQVETVSAATEAIIPKQRTSSGVEDAAGQAREKLDAALAASAKIKALSQGAPGAPTASAAAPAPVSVASVLASDVDQIPAARPRRKGHAVVIGIERYRAKLPPADFAGGDAALIAKYAVAVLGYPEENVALLNNDEASRSDFDKYFDKWLPNRVEKDDEVLVYFSGHGSPNPKTGDAYVVPYDGDPAYLEETAYPLAKLYAALAKLPTKKVTVVLDSCFSGAGGRSVLAKGARPLVATKTEESVAGITVIAASAADQVSNSYQEKGHGLFTYYFLRGLREKGSDLRAAFEYLKPEVQKIARRQYNADQVPQWRAGR